MNAVNSGRKPVRRDVLRRRRRERQILVFGLLAIVLASVAFAATAVYRGDVDGPFVAPIYTPPSDFESDIRLACPPVDTFPLNEAEVPVRVFNGSTVQGLAGNVANTLEGRNFYIVSIGNAARAYSGVVRITYGAEGLVRAYTLARHFEEVELIYDTRENGVIDLTLGAEFEVTMIRALLSPELQSESVLTARAQCLPLSLIVPEPAPRNIPADPLDDTATPSPSPENSQDQGDPDEVTD